MLFISIVSHNHFGLIKKIGSLPLLKNCDFVKVIIRDNVGEKSFDKWCKSYGFKYICNDNSYGFGKNNNLNFFDLEITDEDLFLVMNPDVSITEESLLSIQREMVSQNLRLATINLFKDEDFANSDTNIRRFPTLLDFILRFLLNTNDTIIDKSSIDNHSKVDWASGSFLIFSVPTYKRLAGFDENYFMYCEDIDICMRFFKTFGSKVTFLKEIRGVHFAQHKNRSVFTRHFFWHLKSVFRFLIKFNKFSRTI